MPFNTPTNKGFFSSKRAVELVWEYRTQNVTQELRHILSRMVRYHFCDRYHSGQQDRPSRQGMQKTLADPKFTAEGATGTIQFNTPINSDRKNLPSNQWLKSFPMKTTRIISRQQRDLQFTR